jgi:hypothetical protein|nr:MAG TPA: hypothetical protein [Caudoviricetes sp.]
MNLKDLKFGLQVITPQGDIFEVCGTDVLKEELLVKIVEFATKGPMDEEPMDRYGRDFASDSGWVTEHGKNVMKRGFYEVHYKDFSLWYEDVPNFKEGDIVKDLDGNKYRIDFVGGVSANPDIYKLELLEFSGDHIQRLARKGQEFEEVGSKWYIYNTKNDAVRHDNYLGIYQLFASELMLVEPNTEVATPEVVPVAPSTPRLSIDEIREITANAEQTEISKLLDISYSSILEAASKGIREVPVTKTYTVADLKVIEYFRSEGFTVNDFLTNFEIKW